MKKEKINKRSKRSFGSRIAEHFKNLDLYGKNIMLTYEGNEKFKTHIGALISLWILMMVTTYLALQLRVMILKNNTSFSKNSLQKDLTNDNEVHYIGAGNIDLGFKIDYNGVNILTDSSYFTYSIKQVSQLYIQQGGSYTYQRTKTNLAVDKWTVSSYDQLSQDLYDRLNVGEYQKLLIIFLQMT